MATAPLVEDGCLWTNRFVFFSPNTGCILAPNGPLSGYSPLDRTISDDIEPNANFDPSPYDGDGDGLSDHYETVIFGSNPNSTDSDGDGFSDLEKNSTV